MATLDQIKQMQQKGISDTQIMQTLQEQGVSPREISEGLSQSKVKSAIEQQNPQATPRQQPPQPPAQLQNATQVPEGMNTTNEQSTGTDEMQPSIGSQQNQSMTPESPTSTAQPPMPSIPEQSVQQNQNPPQPMYNQQPAEQQYSQDQYAQQPYDQYAGYDQTGYDQSYYQQGGIDLQSIKDISKQIIEQETEKIRDKLNNLEKEKTESKFQLEQIDNRLKKIEKTIEELQSAILQRIGNYGKAVQDVSKELRATQNSFKKLAGPIIDNQRQSSNNNKKKQQPNKPKPSIGKRESSTGFEDYFR